MLAATPCWLARPLLVATLTAALLSIAVRSSAQAHGADALPPPTTVVGPGNPADVYRDVFPSGDAQFFGSAGTFGAAHLMVDLARTPSNRGYWLVGSDGGVFAFLSPSDALEGRERPCGSSEVADPSKTRSPAPRKWCRH